MQNSIQLAYEIINNHFYYKKYDDLDYDLSISCSGFSDDEKEEYIDSKLEGFDFTKDSQDNDIMNFIIDDLYDELELDLEEIRYFLNQLEFDIKKGDYNEEGEFKKPYIYREYKYKFLEDLLRDFLILDWKKVFKFLKEKKTEQQEIDLNDRSDLEDEQQAYDYWLQEGGSNG